MAGAEVRQMLAGTLNVNMVIDGVVYGKVVGFVADHVGGGSANVDQSAGTVGAGGSLIGAQIGAIGPRPVIASHGPGASGDKPGQGSGSRSAEGSKGVSTGGSATVNQGVGAVGAGGTVVGVNTGTLIITQGGAPAAVEQPGPQIEEVIRLDVAAPATALIDEPFDLAVAVRQPSAPPLAIEDLGQVLSEEGRIFRSEQDQLVRYRIEVSGSGVVVTPPSYRLLLRPGENSRPCFFQVTPTRPGRRSLVVTAYQEDETVAAQTRVRIDVQVEIHP
jgi:hypothetical protein